MICLSASHGRLFICHYIENGQNRPYFGLAVSNVDMYILPPSGFPVNEEQLQEAATESEVLHVSDDFLPSEVRAECQRIIPDCETIRPDECRDAYMYLKRNFTL